MFAIGIYLGILSYSIFGLGLVGLLYRPLVILVTLLVTAGFGIYIWFNSSLRGGQWRLLRFARYQTVLGVARNDRRWNKLLIFSIILLILQSIINLIGTLGPELGFDALWYHLTLPKIYLLYHQVVHIPGGLLYYSDIPKLTEMLYVVGLSLGSEIFPKLMHFGFGILSLIALYILARKFFSPKIAMLAPLIFASNLVFGWESISAYVDLARTFFEILAFLAFVYWTEGKEDKYLIESAVFLGLAITSKFLAIGSLLIFLTLIVYVYKQRKSLRAIFTSLLSFILISVIIPLPWFVFSYLHTGNPFYPFFSQAYPSHISWNLGRFWDVFSNAADPLSPIYLACVPLFLFFWKMVDKKLSLVGIYSIAALFIWYITPDTGGGRFLLPYLPVLSIAICSLFTIKGNDVLKKSLLGFIFLTVIISIGYRGVANAKFIPVILGYEKKQHFLSSHLNFSFGDFADTDGYFRRNIKPTDKVLLYGFHNLYYVDFPFIDNSWVKKGDSFAYIAVQDGKLPERFKYWNLIYMNTTTGVKLYSAGGFTWTY